MEVYTKREAPLRITNLLQSKTWRLRFSERDCKCQLSREYPLSFLEETIRSQFRKAWTYGGLEASA